MEHWAQKCDGAGVDPAQYAKVCLERDELKAAYEAAQMALKVLNEKLVQSDSELQSVKSQLHESKSERDALLEDMKLCVDCCKICSHEMSLPPAGCDGDCLQCKLDCYCKDCLDGKKFEWRGIAKEDAT